MRKSKILSISLVVVLIFGTSLMTSVSAYGTVEPTETEAPTTEPIDTPEPIETESPTETPLITATPTFTTTPIATATTTPSAFIINIIPPTNWKTKEADVKVDVNYIAGTDGVTLSTLEAKIGQNGSWIDITNINKISISENCTVYVQATDSNGKVYTKSQYIKCFDRTSPTVKANLKNYILHIETNDDLSGISEVYINGYVYTKITNDTLDLSIRDIYDYENIETFTILAIDYAGNMSSIYSVKNSYFQKATPTPSATTTPPPIATLSPTSTPISTAPITPTTPVLTNIQSVKIDINKPNGWYSNVADVKITVSRVEGLSDNVITKIEAKINNDGIWQDITYTSTIPINDNCTIYVQATDSKGNIYSNNAYIQCFDKENPIVKADFVNDVLNIEATDKISGISAIYVNGEEHAKIANDNLSLSTQEIKDLDKLEEISVQAVDNAGNFSDMLNIKNPTYKAPEPPKPTQKYTQTSKPVITGQTKPIEVVDQSQQVQTPQPTSNPNVPDGNASTIENITSGGREFYTVQTKDGSIFYMIINKDKTDGNVYFLTEIDQSNMESIAKTSGDKPTPVPTAITPVVVAPSPTTTPEPTPTPVPVETAQPITPEQQKSGSSGLLIFVLLIMAGVTGSGYYYKIYKPKKDLESAEDLEDFEMEENEVNEDISEKEEKINYEDEYQDSYYEDDNETIDEDY